MRRAAVGLALWLVAACADVPQAYDLDHARVLAVRIEPPGLAAGETARIDVLVTDSTAIPRVAAPGDVEVAAPALGEVRRDDDGWFVIAPAAEVLAAADAPVVVLLSLSVTTADGPLDATKTVAYGAALANPAPPAILVDGAATARPLELDRATPLGVAAPDPDHSYRWFSSVGELVGYTRPAASVTPEAPGDGWLVVVERDQQGGTAWTLQPQAVAE